MERISYARILIEMDVTTPLPEVVKVKDPNGRQFDQRVEYVWKPKYYGTTIGHYCKEPKQLKKSKSCDQQCAEKGVAS